MPAIPLNHGQQALVDEEDYARLFVHTWRALKSERSWHVVRMGKDRVTVYMHREILGFGPGDPEVDHRDCNGLNNCRSNLRPATKSQNVANAPARKDNQSSFKGVYLRRDRTWNKYHAQIRVSGKLYHLGYHPTAEAASSAYFEAAKKHFGEFAHV
jgi:hypothetical protein